MGALLTEEKRAMNVGMQMLSHKSVESRDQPPLERAWPPPLQSGQKRRGGAREGDEEHLETQRHRERTVLCQWKNRRKLKEGLQTGQLT